MSSFQEQVLLVVSAALLVTGIITLVSFIVFFIEKLRSNELSDQLGWPNFKKPIVGLSFVLIALLSIVLVVLILIAGLD